MRHVSLTLGADEVLALVEENGSGKTTLVKLPARLCYALSDLRDNIGVTFEDFVRYHLTAGENIAVGRIDERDHKARIEAAAQSGQADQVIARLARDYDQMMGIALARAYMAEAQVMILDEPTAALAARAELMVFERFRELARARAAIVISHRFSTVRMADRIVVLAGGEVEAGGSRDELMAARALRGALRAAGRGLSVRPLPRRMETSPRARVPPP